MSKKSDYNKNSKTILNIRAEHDRIKRSMLHDDSYGSRTTVSLEEVLRSHFLLVEYFAKIGEGVGGIGPKSPDLLHSALSRQFTEFSGKPKWKNRIEVCATLVLGLVKNHPFYDANKRTALIVSMLHLQKIRRTPISDGEIFEDFIVDLANNEVERHARDWKLKEVPSGDREVMIIADFFNYHTRNIDLGTKTMTYKELETLIRKFGLELQNPKGNKIDLVRVSDIDGNALDSPTRIAHIGYHGETKEVSKKDINIIRSAANLDVKHGYDSQAFFYGHETPLSMIKKYEEPLRRLAFR